MLVIPVEEHTADKKFVSRSTQINYSSFIINDTPMKVFSIKMTNIVGKIKNIVEVVNTSLRSLVLTSQMNSIRVFTKGMFNLCICLS